MSSRDSPGDYVGRECCDPGPVNQLSHPGNGAGDPGGRLSVGARQKAEAGGTARPFTVWRDSIARTALILRDEAPIKTEKSFSLKEFWKVIHEFTAPL